MHLYTERAFGIAAIISTLLVMKSSPQITGLTSSVPKPICVPCQPKDPIVKINCNCRQMTTLKIPTIPGVNKCMNILVALCAGQNAAKANIGDFIGALAGVTKCFVKLTSINVNYTDMSQVKSPDGQSTARLLEQLLGGVGKLVDNLLAGLLGNGSDGGLLGTILG